LLIQRGLPRGSSGRTAVDGRPLSPSMGRTAVDLSVHGSVGQLSVRGHSKLKSSHQSRWIVDKKFWVHATQDHVGVAVDDIATGEEVIGVFMDTGKEVHVKSRDDIPLGHKIALKDIKKDEGVIEYGEVIGAATKGIRAGDHVHTDNLKSLRWAAAK
jgi:(2R)-sulfolactate sulfo-lyase subunit alpha